MSHRYYCTYFDSRYLTRGLALYSSLARNGHDFTLFVLALDEITWSTLSSLKLPNVEPIRLTDVEAADVDFASTKRTRSTTEYYWTSTPVLPLFLLRLFPEIDVLFYLDADLYFFSSPEIMFDDMQDGSVYIIPHRFSRRYEHNAQSAGTYNVGAVGFRNDGAGRACLQWWRDRCLEWCYDKHEEDKYGDQKYLDGWPELFDNVVVSHHPGCNVASWNVDNYRVTTRGAQVYVADVPLVFYHYHRFKHLRWGLYELAGWGYRLRRDHRALIYAPYIHALTAAATELSAYVGPNLLERTTPGPRRLLQALYEGRLYWDGSWPLQRLEMELPRFSGRVG